MKYKTIQDKKGMELKISVKHVLSITYLIFLICVPVAELCLGILHINECPMEFWLPRFLIVSGIIGINLAFTSVLIMYLQYNEHVPAIKCIELFRIIVVFLIIIWNIFGSVWTFPHWSDWNRIKKSQNDGCHSGLFLFTFSYLIIFWITTPCHIGIAFSRYKIQRNLHYHKDLESDSAGFQAVDNTTDESDGLT